MSKIIFSSILLVILGIISVVFGVIKNTVFIFVGILLLVLGIIRILLVRNIDNYQNNYANIYDDMIAKYLKSDLSSYVLLYEMYKYSDCELVYGENDGILLYDPKSDTYLASAKTKAGALDIFYKMKKDVNEILLFDDIFDEFNFDVYIKKECYLISNYKKIKYNINFNNIKINQEENKCEIDTKNYIKLGKYFAAEIKSEKNEYKKLLISLFSNQRSKKHYFYLLDEYNDELYKQLKLESKKIIYLQKKKEEPLG